MTRSGEKHQRNDIAEVFQIKRVKAGKAHRATEAEASISAPILNADNEEKSLILPAATALKLQPTTHTTRFMSKPGWPLEDISMAQMLIHSLESSEGDTEGILARLRRRNCDRTLPFPVKETTFIKLRDETDGRFEYDSMSKVLVLKAGWGPLRASTVSMFSSWLRLAVKEAGKEDELYVVVAAERETHHRVHYKSRIADVLVERNDLWEGPPLVIVEVSVSRESSSHEARAKEWLFQGEAQLVIVADIQVLESADIKDPRYSESTLPYGLTYDDLKTANLPVITSKILESPDPFIELVSGTIYIYRRSEVWETVVVEAVIFAEKKELIPFEVVITDDDLGIIGDGKYVLSKMTLMDVMEHGVTRENRQAAQTIARRLVMDYRN